MHSQLRQPKEQMTAGLLPTISHPSVDIIGHPHSRLTGHWPPAGAELDQTVLMHEPPAQVALAASADRIEVPSACRVTGRRRRAWFSGRRLLVRTW
jgi:hypothetical protein